MSKKPSPPLTWFFSMNLPIAQIYHIGLSNENPYVVCAGLQDNNAWCGPSNSLDPSGIPNKYWIATTGGDGEWAVPDPVDKNLIWSDSEDGSLGVYDKVTQDGWNAQPFLQLSTESFDLRTSKYRFNWDSPIAFAPWDGHIAWYGANVVFQSTDRGISWTPISPDLTLNIKAHQIPSGGPITNDVSGAEYSDTILDIEGSTLHKGEIWVGTDDGLVQLTLDGGKHWRNVTPPGTQPYGRIETIAPSALRDGTAYASLDRHFLGDNTPYLWVTHNFGKTWQSIVNGLPAGQIVRTVRPDVRNASILYAGTENGVWISFDGGANWKAFQNGLPPASVQDIRMQPTFDDLVIATHGRSAYIMDDMAPIQELSSATATGYDLFGPRTAYEYNQHSNDEGTYTDYAASNPDYGVLITFYQKDAQKNALSLQILDTYGRVVRTVSGTHKVNDKDTPYITNKVGLNRYTWDFQVDGPTKWMGAAKERYQGPNEGPAVVPGRYSVRMKLGGHTYVRSFTVAADPNTIFKQPDFQRAYDFSMRAQTLYSNVDAMLNALDAVKKQLDATNDVAKKSNNATLQQSVTEELATRKTLFDSLTADYQNDEDGIERPGALREDVGGLQDVSLLTPPVVEFGKRVETEYAQVVGRYNACVRTELPKINAAAQQAGLKTVTTMPTMR